MARVRKGLRSRGWSGLASYASWSLLRWSRLRLSSSLKSAQGWLLFLLGGTCLSYLEGRGVLKPGDTFQVMMVLLALQLVQHYGGIIRKDIVLSRLQVRKIPGVDPKEAIQISPNLEVAVVLSRPLLSLWTPRIRRQLLDPRDLAGLLQYLRLELIALNLLKRPLPPQLHTPLLEIALQHSHHPRGPYQNFPVNFDPEPLNVHWGKGYLEYIERNRILSDIIVPGEDEDYVLGQAAPNNFLLLDWPGGTGPSVMNKQYCEDHSHNEGHLAHPSLEEILTKGPFIGFHYAEDYLGMVWYDPEANRFFEQVDRNGEHIDTGADTNLNRLVKDIKNNYGTE